MNPLLFLSRTVTWALAMAVFCLPTAVLGAAEEEGRERVIGLAESASATDRLRLARTLFSHDFENRRSLDTGIPSPLSADLDNDGWPDFWEPILAVGYPEYLINTISIVPDRSPFLSGAYRDTENHVLHMAYDGTRVGARTSMPVAVNPELAYEFSLRVRDNGIFGAKIRAGVEWIRIDETVTEYLRQDEIPDLKTGQIDWPARPIRTLINDVPPGANAARFFLVIERDPEAVSVAHHGNVWFDDIRLRPLPKVRVNPVDLDAAVDGSAVEVDYSGLIDNIPDPNNPGFFRGKRYSRSVSATDIFNRPIPGIDSAIRRLNVGDEDRHRERIVIPSRRYGVYYLNLKIYDADERLAASITRAVAVPRPARSRDRLDMRSGKPIFGLRADAPPRNALAVGDFLRNALERAGVQQIKITPWPEDFDANVDQTGYYLALAEEIRKLRSAGIRITGVIDPPPQMADGQNLATVMEENPDQLQNALQQAGRHLGLFMDGWQWGNDADDSVAAIADNQSIDRFAQALSQFAGGLPMTANVRIGGPVRRVPEYFGVVGGRQPARAAAADLWRNGAAIFPWLYEPFFFARAATYPPPELTRLAPAPPVDIIEANNRESLRKGVWINLEQMAATPGEPDASEERAQLERMLVDAVYAAALAPDIIFLGKLFESARGVLRWESGTERPNIGALARPTFLAASVLSDMLGGAEYLGRYDLLPPFEAHAFRRPGADQAVIALWHNDADGARALSRADIASGPPLRLTDWAGNSEPLPSSIPVQRVPSFITGMPASMALTRMSVRINPDMPIKAQNRRQNQQIEIVNHMPVQAPILFRLRYAARLADGGMENGWAINPEEMRANLSPVSRNFTPARLPFTASPDPNSPVQQVSPTGFDKSGDKLAQVRMTLSTSPPADMSLYLRFPLRSDIDVDVTELVRADDPHFATLQLRCRWFPTGNDRRRGEISLMPFYLRKGEMKETAPMPVTLRASPLEDRGKPDARYETVEIRIPRNPPRQTWVGLTEEGGSNFYLADITELLAR